MRYKLGGRYHYMSQTPTYRSWGRMRQRCKNPNNNRYNYYGGRGIRVTPRWDCFALFISDMGERPTGHTLDRIDNSKDYYPDNCRWATPKQQANNRRPKGSVL